MVVHSYVRWLDEIGRAEPSAGDTKRPSPEMIGLAGGKGANLAEMARAGIIVPPAFVITANTYREFIDLTGLAPTIQRALACTNVANPAELSAAAEAIKSAIVGAQMPEVISGAIQEAYEELGGLVAVRSSATAEDLPDASFAGQQATFLNISGQQNVVSAVQRCWASLFEARAIFYRAERAYDHSPIAIAVVVQRMIQSEVSGVMFTVEPLSNDPTTICIEAVYGLGEGIVSGELTPDRYLVRKNDLTVMESSINTQNRRLMRAAPETAPEAGENSWQTVPEVLQSRPKLVPDMLQAVAEAGLRLERLYGRPQDVEWAIERGHLHIVQSRPITTLGQRASAFQERNDTEEVLVSGSGASPGIGRGTVRIIRRLEDIEQLRVGDVLVAEMTTPDFVPAMKRAAAIVTDRGGRTCHAAIVSRELGVPCVVGTGNGTEALATHERITVDGFSGKIYDGFLKITEVKSPVLDVAHPKTRTRIYVNLADPDLAATLAARAVDGVGLLRAEFMIAQMGDHPRHMMQQGRGAEFTSQLAAGIRRFAQAFAPRPVVYRLSDFKTNEYRNLRGGEQYEAVEENPMLGFRGASRYLADEGVFELEAGAVKQVVGEYDNLKVMVPFVRSPAELAAVKQLLGRCGLGQVALWMMCEIPANVILLEQFLEVGIEGVSIGSNDLTQLVLGIDRDNARLADAFDERNEAVLWALERAIRICRRRNVPVSICGQAPSFYPELTAKLVRWGIASVSVSPDMIDQTRQIVAEAEAAMRRRRQRPASAAARD